jgi:hypothetical protein
VSIMVVGILFLIFVVGCGVNGQLIFSNTGGGAVPAIVTPSMI